ncbi:MAG: DUF3305 domain-containing protein [Burkholderiales bacterium]
MPPMSAAEFPTRSPALAVIMQRAALASRWASEQWEAKGVVDGIACPQMLTVSYAEGTRWADSGEQVDGVPLPQGLGSWMAEFVQANYRPSLRNASATRANAFLAATVSANSSSVGCSPSMVSCATRPSWFCYLPRLGSQVANGGYTAMTTTVAIRQTQ